MLTKKQQEFFNRLKEQYGKNPLPSFEIIAKEFGFKHKNSVWQYFNKLKEAQLIKEENNKFFISPFEFGAILYTNPVKAGFPSPAEDHTDRRMSLDEEFRLDNPSTFIVPVKGDSMIDAGILEDDKVIVKKCSIARDGDVVVAWIDGAFTLKTYRKKGSKVYLEAANTDYEDIIPENELTIFGVVTGVVRSLGN